jgi:hypothetical protein
MNQAEHVPRWLTVSIWILATVVPLLAISQQSFWIDEAMTETFATVPRIGVFWKKVTTEMTSEVQMPLYMIYAWGWQRIFGGSEYSLRLANYPWFLLGQFAGAFIWADRRKGLLFIAVAACSSFIWFYLNEARPYILEYGAACIVVLFLCFLLREDSVSSWKYWLFSFGVVALAGANMLGAFWVGTAIAIATFLLLRKRVRPPLFPLLSCAAALLILGSYYLWTLLIGARATYAHESILNILYLFYELGGFVGLGPGRLDVREHALASFYPYLIPVGVFASLVFFILLGLWKTGAREQDRSILVATAVFALPPLFLLSIIGMFVDFRVLGRHVMPAAPLIFVLITLGIDTSLRRGTVFGRALVVSFFFLSLVSCFGVRFFPWHMKDDYRGAARAVSAMLADHQVAWWCASKEGGEYYHLPLDGAPDRDGRLFVYVRNPNAEGLQKLPAPAVVALSKGDLYDENGTIAAMLKEQQFIQRQTLPAFSIWERPR